MSKYDLMLNIVGRVVYFGLGFMSCLFFLYGVR
jgi:hypothetical protein